MRKWLENIQYTLACYVRFFGYTGPAVPVLARLCKLVGCRVELSLGARALPERLHIRLGSSDLSVLYHIFFDREYEWEMPRKPKVIVDAGANIGLASVYYAHKYPEARIFAIEPEQSNLALLYRNTEHYKNVTVIPAGLWKEDRWLQIVDPGRDEWGYQAQPLSANQPVSHHQSVRGVALDSLMEEHNIQYVDILKVDIEGAECEVFGSSSPWIDRVGLVVAELHDWILPGCSDSFYEATMGFELESQVGEKIVRARKGYFRDLQADSKGNR